MIFCLVFPCTNLNASEVNTKDGWTHLILPVSDSFVFTQIPSTWQQKPVFNSLLKKKGMHLMGFFPEGQGHENWNEMITVLGQKSSKFTPDLYFKLMVQKRLKSCSKEKTSAKIMKSSSDLVIGIIYCGEVETELKKSALAKKGQGEISAYRIFKNEGYLFPIIRVWRGNSFNIKDPDEKNFPATRETIKKYFAASTTSQICSKERPQGKCSDYLSKLAKDAPENSPSVIETHNVKQAFKIPLSKDKDIDNPGWINILFPTHEKFVLTQIPEGWELEPYTEEKDASTHSYIFFPNGQKYQNWTESLVVEEFQKTDLAPKKFFENKFKQLEKGCEKGNTAGLKIEEDKNTMVFLWMCGKVKDESANGKNLDKEVGAMSVERVIRKDNSLTKINYSWRGKPFSILEKDDKNLPVSANVVANYVNASSSTMVCDKMNPDSPCKKYATAEHRHPKMTNYSTWGSLLSFNPIGCEKIENVTNRHTPADINKGISECLEKGKYENAVYLHALAGTYAYFDKLRVGDKSAHNAYSMLLTRSLRSVKNSVETFKKKAKNILGQKPELSTLCKKVKTLGGPDYYPNYMVEHGMQALSEGVKNNGLVKDFNPTTAWETSLEKFLKCPKN
ncbi:MAG: hypothetical protein VW455_12250 [Nitrospinota bacterium]